MKKLIIAVAAASLLALTGTAAQAAGHSRESYSRVCKNGVCVEKRVEIRNGRIVVKSVDRTPQYAGNRYAGDRNRGRHVDNDRNRGRHVDNDRNRRHHVAPRHRRQRQHWQSRRGTPYWAYQPPWRGHNAWSFTTPRYWQFNNDHE